MSEVRALVLMCGASMEDEMVAFAKTHKDIISKFRLIAPASVLERIRCYLGSNSAFSVSVEPNYLGGDAMVATQVVVHDVGAALIFRDPVGASGAACDCDALLRLLNVHNIINATNPATADMLINLMDEGITTGAKEIMPSFYESLESPAVAAYQAKQNAVIAACSSSGGASAPPKPKEVVGEARSLTAINETVEKGDTAFQGSNKLSRVRRRSMQLQQGHGDDLAKTDLSWEAPKSTVSNPENVQHAQDMRCLALISHNNMKGAMKEFVIRHQEVLKRFRLTGTKSTMTMLKTVLGTEGVAYGPTCSSGPLGGDAEVGALMCVGDLGGMIFFTDPLDPHPHASDILALIRMCDLHNLMHASNPSTGDALVRVLAKGLKDRTLIPTFYTSKMSAAINWHSTHDKGACLAEKSDKPWNLKEYAPWIMLAALTAYIAYRK